MLAPASSVLDAGAEPKTIHKRRIDPTWHSYFRPVKSSEILDASKWIVKFCSLIQFTIRIGELWGSVPFLLVQNLAVKCPAGASFIGRHVFCILPRLWKLVLYHSSSVSATGQRYPNRLETSLSLKFRDRFPKIRTTQKLATSPTSQARVPAKCRIKGTTLLTPPVDLHQKTCCSGEWD